MRFAHTNIVAKDWKRLAEFYMTVFSCRIKPPERKLAGYWLDKATGLTNAEIEGVHLLLPGYADNGPTLEIFTYGDTAERKAPMPNHTGFSHIAFEVEDVNAILKNALENGAGMLGKITEREIKGVGKLKFVYFRDPEGNIIEIQSWDR